MTTALEAGEWTAARPGLLYPQERPGSHCTGGWVGPRVGLDENCRLERVTEGRTGGGIRVTEERGRRKRRQILDEFNEQGSVNWKGKHYIALCGEIDLEEGMDLSPWMWVPVTTAWRVLGLRMEERPPIWRVAVNKWNKQPRTADEGWSSSLGVGRGANNPSP